MFSLVSLKVFLNINLSNSPWLFELSLNGHFSHSILVYGACVVRMIPTFRWTNVGDYEMDSICSCAIHTNISVDLWWWRKDRPTLILLVSLLFPFYFLQNTPINIYLCDNFDSLFWMKGKNDLFLNRSAIRNPLAHGDVSKRKWNASCALCCCGKFLPKINYFSIIFSRAAGNFYFRREPERDGHMHLLRNHLFYFT